MRLALPDQGAQPFHDILDGYFTLKESVRQLMVRHAFSWAWLILNHAPIMELKGLPPDAPVPLHLRDGYAGMIDALIMTVTPAQRPDPDGALEGVGLLGTGEWRWLDARADTCLPPDIRLAEPAYVTGFGLSSRPGPNKKPLPAEEITTELARMTSQSGTFRVFSA